MSVQNLSGHAIAYRWRSLPRIHWHRASSPQGSCRNRCCLFRLLHGPSFCAPFIFHAHYWYAVDMMIHVIQRISEAFGSLWNRAFALGRCSHPSSSTSYLPRYKRSSLHAFQGGQRLHGRSGALQEENRGGGGGSNHWRASPGNFAVRHVLR